MLNYNITDNLARTLAQQLRQQILTRATQAMLYILIGLMVGTRQLLGAVPH